MSSDSSPSDKLHDLSGIGRALLGTGSGTGAGTGSKPSAAWVPPTAEELHQILPQYEIVKMLGRGGMGAVYMGTQTALDRPVAIKILSAALEDSDAGFAERFKNEARAMAKLNHPGIVSVYDFGEAPGGLLYIVMEYVEGTDVAKMIAAKSRLHTEHAMAVTAHVCDALAYAHERGIIHRDIKPANIMVGYDGTVKVADFGLAKVNVGGDTLGLTHSGMAMGTLHYMAPEALMLGTAVDHRADIYAVGVMLYQMLSGKVPHGMFKMPSMVVAGLDPRYDGIIQKAMMEDRETRYQSARELRGDLDGILTQPVAKVEPEAAQPAAALPTQARPQRPGVQPSYRPPQARTPTSPPPPRKASYVWLWLTVLLLAMLGGAYVALRPRQRPEQPVPAAIQTPPPSIAGAIIAITSPDAVRILRLEPGQPRLYDSNPLRVIESVSPDLAGWQFTSIPQRIDNEYEIRVQAPGVIYAFGGRHPKSDLEDIFGADAARWIAADSAIKGTMIKMCYRREVASGDVIRLKAFELQLAAPTIAHQTKAGSSSPAPAKTQQSVPPAPVKNTGNAATTPAPTTVTPAAPPTPAPAKAPASDTTWTDVQGRTLQAKFVRVEGAQVVLDVAGKATPVALETLAPESQQQARRLAAAQPVTAPPEDGFISLLDGYQSRDWAQIGPGRIDFQGGIATTSSPSKWGVAVYTKRTFSNFILRAEFKGVGAQFNSGLWLRIEDIRNIEAAASTRYEVGIIHSGDEQGRFTGTIWATQPARLDAVKMNDWNELEITVTGQRHLVRLNGQVVNDFTGSKGTTGYIGIEENAAGPVQFRSVRVKPLP